MKPGSLPIALGTVAALVGVGLASASVWIVPCTGFVCPAGPYGTYYNEPYYAIGFVLVAAGIVAAAAGLFMRARESVLRANAQG